MAGVDRQLIESSVLNMFQVNLGLRDGEKVLVVTDPPLLPPLAGGSNC